MLNSKTEKSCLNWMPK